MSTYDPQVFSFQHNPKSSRLFSAINIAKFKKARAVLVSTITSLEVVGSNPTEVKINFPRWDYFQISFKG